MGGFKIEKNPNKFRFVPEQILDLFRTKVQKFVRSILNEQKLCSGTILFMMMPGSSSEGFGDLNPYDDAV
jgi:hypothetical protein